MKALNSGISGLGTTIFETMSRLATEHGAVNLGQGFPEGLEPPGLVAAAISAFASVGNQYPPMPGLATLRQAAADHDRRFYGLDLDWQAEVLVTSGATEALAAAFLALIEPGDEVIVLEPAYDSYLPMIRRAGGVPRIVRLAAPAWSLPRRELAAAFGPRTKFLLLNSPHNPLGKVFTDDELGFVAELLARHDAYAVCDEVYEHIVLEGAHRPLMTFPGMRDRCIRIGSAGKTFSVTGWKIGIVAACPRLLGPVTKAHQYLAFSTPPALQAAVAEGLGWPDAYFDGLTETLRQRKALLAKGLAEGGFRVLPSDGTYFVVADYAALSDLPPMEFCAWLVREAGVAAVPLSAFSETPAAEPLIRFCFAKTEATLVEAARRLRPQADARAS